MGSGVFGCKTIAQSIAQLRHRTPHSEVCQYPKDAHTVIVEIFVRVKISYSSVPQRSYATNFRTATVVCHALVYVHGFRMLLNFVLSAKSTKYRENLTVRALRSSRTIFLHAKNLFQVKSTKIVIP